MFEVEVMFLGEINIVFGLLIYFFNFYFYDVGVKFFYFFLGNVLYFYGCWLIICGFVMDIYVLVEEVLLVV